MRSVRKARHPATHKTAKAHKAPKKQAHHTANHASHVKNHASHAAKAAGHAHGHH